MSESRYPAVIVMGVQGSGKSTIGRALATRLGFDFIDGDDLHPAANKAKMAAGHPLDDDDRRPWLNIIGSTIAGAVAAGEPVVVVCSALKRAYRDVLRSHVAELFFLHLDGEQSVIAKRLALRDHEFMPPSLLGSQFATLQPLGTDERGLRVDFARSPAEIIDLASPVLAAAAAGGPA